MDLKDIKVSTDEEVLARALAEQVMGEIPHTPPNLLSLIRDAWTRPEVIEAIRQQFDHEPGQCVLNQIQLGFALGVHFMGLKVAEAMELGERVAAMPADQLQAIKDWDGVAGGGGEGRDGKVN